VLSEANHPVSRLVRRLRRLQSIHGPPAKQTTTNFQVHDQFVNQVWHAEKAQNGVSREFQVDVYLLYGEPALHSPFCILVATEDINQDVGVALLWFWCESSFVQ